MRTVLGEPGAIGQAEVQHPQFAIFSQQQVFWLDVAVQDLPAMQQAHGAQQAFGNRLPLCQRQRALLLEQLGQGLPGVFAHHVVQMLTATGGMHFGKGPAGDPAQKPFLR